MKQVNVHEAKTQLSRLLQDVEDGEEVVIARNGTPVAKLVPHVEERKPREPGWAKGRVWIAIKIRIGKLELEVDLAAGSADHGFEPLGITFGHAVAAGRLPPHHGDPFDRMLVAQ